jgi:two-component system alkaline phosphatase synthesis response regulator PhoP
VESRILVVDDDPHIVRLLRAYLEQAGFHVLAAYDGAEAMRILRAERPDLVLLDLMLPDRDGREVTRIVRSDPSLAHTPIVMLTARVEDRDKIVGLELGADDYVTKPFNPGEVVARVRAVLRRAQDGPVSSRILQVGRLMLDQDRHQVRYREQQLPLTPTEFSLLWALARRAGYALTRLELIEAALGYQYEGLERTVDSHIKNLRRKLDQGGGQGTGASWIETVFGVGYRLRPEADEEPAGQT